MLQLICLVIYYAIGRYLPCSYSRFGGSFSTAFRRYLCKRIFFSMGENVNIERGAFFGRGNLIEIGDFSGLGINCNVPNNIKIGANVMMGPNLFVQGNNHITTRTDISMREQGIKKNIDKVIIEDDVWIGRDVLIIGSKRIQKGSIIGARCVLTKNFPAFSVIGGNPSKLIKLRK